MNPDPLQPQQPTQPTNPTTPPPEEPLFSAPPRTLQPVHTMDEIRPPTPAPATAPMPPVALTVTPSTPTVQPLTMDTPEVDAPKVDTQPVSPAPPEITPPQPVISGMAPMPSMGTPKKRMSRRKRLLLIGSPILVALLVAGAVFGLYLPNTPSGVWNTAVNRTGKALDGVVTSATEIKQLESYKSSQVTGSVTATFGSNSYSGNLNSKYDSASSDSGLNISLKSADGTKEIGAQLLTQTVAGNVYPDLYFKVTGLKAAGLDQLAPELAGYENRWIVATSDYLKSIGSSLVEGDEKKQSPVTAADTAEAARAVSKVTREYVFSTAKDKAVFVKKRFVAKEKVDSINTYHYKVSINTQHAQAYCEALSTAVISSKAYQKLSGATAPEITKSKQEAKKSCADNTKDNLKSSDEYDLWVDGKYKLIHKIRQYDENSTTEYTELGHNYKGDDELSLFVQHINTKDGSSSKATLGTNLKTNVTSATFTYTNGSKTDPASVKATFTMKPLSGKLQVTKPTDAIPLQQLLDALGYGALTSNAASTGSVSEQSQDAERQADIQALQTYLEAYFAENGSYPTFANLNNAAWRSTNMDSLDAMVLTDPAGSGAALASTATKNAYSYQPSGCSASGCTGYTITAYLSSGTTYTKTALD